MGYCLVTNYCLNDFINNLEHTDRSVIGYVALWLLLLISQLLKVFLCWCETQSSVTAPTGTQTLTGKQTLTATQKITGTQSHLLVIKFTLTFNLILHVLLSRLHIQTPIEGESRIVVCYLTSAHVFLLF